jgi:hypothetical protein
MPVVLTHIYTECPESPFNESISQISISVKRLLGHSVYFSPAKKKHLIRPNFLQVRKSRHNVTILALRHYLTFNLADGARDARVASGKGHLHGWGVWLLSRWVMASSRRTPPRCCAAGDPPRGDSPPSLFRARMHVTHRAKRPLSLFN